MAKYSLIIKSSAQKELDRLDDPLFERIDRKILQEAQNDFKTNGVSAWVIGAWFMPSMMPEL